MKNLKYAFNIIIALTLFTGCKKETPQEVVEKTVLSANLLMANYGGQYFEQLEALDKSNYLEYYDNAGKAHSATYSEYLHKVTIPDLEKSLNDVKALEVNEDSKKLIEASRKLLEFCVYFYKEEYSEIALMYDEGKSPEEINLFIKDFEAKHFEEFKQKNMELDREAKVYADKKGVDLKFV